MIDWMVVLGVAPYVVVALLFAWFALELDSRNAQQVKDLVARYEATISNLVTDNRVRADKIMLEWADRMKERDQEWKTFLVEQRQASNEATARLAEEIKAIGRQVAELSGNLTAHDRNVMDAVTRSKE